MAHIGTRMPKSISDTGARFEAGSEPEGAELEARRVERELRAQLTLAKRHIPQATYTWNHMGFTSLAPEVDRLVSRLSKEYGLVVPAEFGIQPIGRIYDGRDAGSVKAEKLAARLETLAPGLWLHTDHASTDDPEMQAIGHTGYE